VAIVSTATNAVVGELKVQGQPDRAAVSPDGKFVYVPRKENNEGSIEIFDAQTRQPVGSIAGIDEGFGLVMAPDGRTAYLVVEQASGAEVWVVDTALRAVVKEIPLPGAPQAIAISPDGRRAYVAQGGGEDILALDTGTNAVVGSIPIGRGADGIALSPDGKTAYAVGEGKEEVVVVDAATERKVPTSLSISGDPTQIVVAPDQSPTAAFTAPVATAGLPATFGGAASTDPDGTVAAWNWSFGDGGVASGVGVTHTYGSAGTFGATLSVIDNEGCGEASVFTGQTAYCSGNAGATVGHPVTVAPVAVPPRPAPIVCGTRLRFGRIVHNRRNGTVRLRVRVPGPGSLYLFGKKVHAVTLKSVKGTAFLTLHARVEVAKRLKAAHHTHVAYRITFYPTGSCSAPITVHRSVALQRTPRKKHHHKS
jgi:YVTN family beta-propeller protein